MSAPICLCTAITPDLRPCSACLDRLFEEHERRQRRVFPWVAAAGAAAAVLLGILVGWWA